MIYKLHDIERIAGKLLCNDFQSNPSLSFTNTSYGANGTVLGSLSGKDRKNYTKTTILYTIGRERWDSYEVQLKRIEETVAWQIKDNGKVIREYSKNETSDIIMTLFVVSNEYGDTVYTDDPNYADNARKIQAKRYKNNEYVDNKRLVTDPNRYTKLVEYINKYKGKSLKAGTPIYEKINRGNHEVYDYSTHAYIKKKYVELIVYYTYRNKEYTIRKSYINF